MRALSSSKTCAFDAGGSMVSEVLTYDSEFGVASFGVLIIK
jgi:hypothetical protein